MLTTMGEARAVEGNQESGGVPIVTVTLNPAVDRTFAVERVVPERKLAAHDERRFPGGGGVNVARVVHRLGGDERAYWSRGGATGDLLAELLDREGLAHEPVPVSGPTRENVIVREHVSDQQWRFGLPGPELSKDDLQRWREKLESLAPAPGYLVLSGSLPRGVEAEWFGELARAGKARSRVVVDTKGAALSCALGVGVFMIKPNIDELAAIVGRELGMEDAVESAARDIVERGGAEHVLVSLGRAGAVLVSKGEQTSHISAPHVRIRSKVGAGDSMLGGVVFALASGWEPQAAARLGVAAGTAAVMNEGTELCRREDVERLYAGMSPRR